MEKLMNHAMQDKQTILASTRSTSTEYIVVVFSFFCLLSQSPVGMSEINLHRRKGYASITLFLIYASIIWKARHIIEAL